MSRIHFWSDLHLGHQFVAGLRGFKDTERTGILSPEAKASVWHDLHIQEAWMDNVREKDHIWLLGDISGGRNEEYALDFIAGLPGTKHLISGNHDSVSSIHRSSWKKQKRFLEVFESVQDFARMKVHGVDFLLSHYPYAGAGDHKDVERYTEYRLTDTGIPLVHGHVHGAWDYEVTVSDTPMMNVGVDHWFDRPANLEDVIGWLKLERRIK